MKHPMKLFLLFVLTLLLGCSSPAPELTPKPEGLGFSVAPLKDNQGWIHVVYGAAPDHWYEADVLWMDGAGEVDVMYQRFDQDAGAPVADYAFGVPCWVAPHPHVIPGGPPSTGFVFPTPDPRDGHIGLLVDQDAGADSLMVVHPDFAGGTVTEPIPNADLMGSTWSFPMWIPHVLFPIPADVAAIVASACHSP